jgi:SAM-dependent MidA family methyltransferase
MASLAFSRWPAHRLVERLNRQMSEAPLLPILREHIQRDGPLRVDQYMGLCLCHPEHGYWSRNRTIGADGDFITSPEISQVFGELIGLWCATVWEDMGRPAPVRLIELGPGRATLMRDALRAARALPGFLDAAAVHLVEISAPLREAQRQTLSSFLGEGSALAALNWCPSLDDAPAGPAIILANEFLDALPIRQLVFSDGAWRERFVDLDASGGLHFSVGHQVNYVGEEPREPGAIVEIRQAQDEVLASVAARTDPVAALFIDYGATDSTHGDTLQAVHRHSYSDPLAEPGQADLTAHVRFGELARKASNLGLATDGPVSQTEFLSRLGIVERAARLMSANPQRAAEIESGVQRLIAPTGMGQLFNAILVRSPALPPPVPFV